MTRGGRNRLGGLSQTQAAALRRFMDDAKKLPDASEEWLRVDHDISRGALNSFHQTGIIKKLHVDEEELTRHYWRTKQGVHAWLEKRLENRTSTPCENATGFRTIEPGTYTCTDDDCDCRMDRDTVEEVFV